MKVPRWTLFWIVVIGLLVVVEIAEVTQLFRVPLDLVYLSPLSLIVSLVLITILALVGAVFVGFYLSSRIYSARGFTPFEQEMLKSRRELQELTQEVATLRRALAGPVPASPPPAPADPPAGTAPGAVGSAAAEEVHP